MSENTEPPKENDSQNEEGYELIYPFLCTQTRGGPWNDEAFVAGVRLGELTQRMRNGEPLINSPIEPDLTTTLDLAAMHHGYQTLIEDTDDDTWQYVTLTRKSEL